MVETFSTIICKLQVFNIFDIINKILMKVLNSATTYKVLMEFNHPDGRHIPVLLHRRSLAIMTGEARYLWTHG